jgi:hypothetical protein
MDRIDANDFLQSLVGQPLATLTGRPNRILGLDSDAVIVATDRSPGGRSVPIIWVQDALDRLVTDGIVDISVPSVGYRSAFIGAVLSRVPGAVVGDGLVRLSSAVPLVGSGLVSTSSTWVFQAAPGTFDLRGAIAALDRMTWLVQRHERAIHAGDRVYLWTAGPEGGIVAVGSVLDEPSLRLSDPESARFIRDAEHLEGTRMRVMVSVDAVLERPILRSSLLTHPVLRDLTIIRARQGTNFRVTREQAVALQDLAGTVAATSDSAALAIAGPPPPDPEVDRFGVEVARRLLVEEYPGREVDVQAHANPGFDILVGTRSAPVRFVEVKSSANVVPRFFLSENERRFAAANAGRYSLVMVLGIDVKAGTHQAVRWHDGVLDDAAFSFEPLQWSVRWRE